MKRVKRQSPKNEMEKLILEWTNYGSEYLYEEQADKIKLLEQYLSNNNILVEKIYRRTNWPNVLVAKVGDIITLDKISSWSKNTVVPNTKYEGQDSRLLVIENQIVKGQDITLLSSFPEEQEVLLAPCNLLVKSKLVDILEVEYIL